MRRIGLVAAVALAWAGQASATIITTTYQGTVFSGIDALGLFGAAGADLTGDPFSAVVVFDSSLSRQADVRGISVLGGAGLGTPNPFVSTSLTIDGMAYVLPVPAFLSGFFAAYDRDKDGVQTVFSTAVENSIGGGFSAPANVAFMMVLESSPGLFPKAGSALPFTGTGDGRFKPAGTSEMIVLAPVSGLIDPAPPLTYVPEPGAWVLMLAGFGLAGVALRVRRSRVAMST